MKTKLRTMLCFSLLFILLFSASFPVLCAEHDCSGISCSVCRTVRETEELLSAAAPALATLSLGIGLLVTLLLGGTLPSLSVLPTLVGWKVKLSD